MNDETIKRMELKQKQNFMRNKKKEKNNTKKLQQQQKQLQIKQQRINLQKKIIFRYCDNNKMKHHPEEWNTTRKKQTTNIFFSIDAEVT